jgi:hypothetical protein
MEVAGAPKPTESGLLAARIPELHHLRTEHFTFLVKQDHSWFPSQWVEQHAWGQVPQSTARRFLFRSQSKRGGNGKQDRGGSGASALVDQDHASVHECHHFICSVVNLNGNLRMAFQYVVLQCQDRNFAASQLEEIVIDHLLHRVTVDKGLGQDPNAPYNDWFCVGRYLSSLEE